MLKGAGLGIFNMPKACAVDKRIVDLPQAHTRLKQTAKPTVYSIVKELLAALMQVVLLVFQSPAVRSRFASRKIRPAEIAILATTCQTSSQVTTAPRDFKFLVFYFSLIDCVLEVKSVIHKVEARVITGPVSVKRSGLRLAIRRDFAQIAAPLLGLLGLMLSKYRLGN
jgi:hypothetical protein